MRCLVTGATGFLGSHLVDTLVARGDEVTALVREAGRSGSTWPAGVKTVTADLTDRAAMTDALNRAAPEQIFHLAAQSYPTLSWQDPQDTFRANLTGTVVLLEAMRAWGGSARLMVVSSSAIYTSSTRPIPEDGDHVPASPYGVSKLAADFSASLYHLRYGMNVVRVRPFFLIGPRKRADVCADFARRIALAEQSGQGAIAVGQLDVVRDFLDVRDGLSGLVAIMERGVSGEAYNVCSGHGHTLGEVLAGFKSLALVPIQEVVDPDLLRPVDEPVKVGDPARLKGLGWTPACTLSDSLRAILDYWREQVAAGQA